MSRSATTFPLGVPVPPPARSKGRWVVEALRIAVREGRLKPGSRMPGSRDLAEQWGISRGLVSAAYEELQSEGILVGRIGSGTYVAARLGDDPSALAATRPEAAPGRRALDDHPSWVRTNPGRPFIARETDVSLFPIKTWRALARQALGRADGHFFLDPDPAGFGGLREQVARYLGFARGIRCDPDDIVITTGIRHGLDLCLRCCAQPGDVVWTESPGYAGADALLRLHRLTAHPVPVDEHGLRVEAAEATAPDAKLCLVTPSHQSPLGVRLSFERRRTLLAWAERRDGYVFEDDYDSEFAFDAVRFPAFKAMDGGDRIIHAGSFNKVLFPTLRIGYLVLPKALRAKVRQAREETGRGNSATDQHVLSRFLADGHFARHVRRMGSVYREKCTRTARAIAAAYGKPLDVLGDHAGFHFFLLLPDGVRMDGLIDGARACGLTLQGADIRSGHSSRAGLIIGYSSLSLETIDRSGEWLGLLLRSAEGHPPARPSITRGL